MKSVLVLEEHREGRKSLARSLKRKGFPVSQAGDALRLLFFFPLCRLTS